MNSFGPRFRNLGKWMAVVIAVTSMQFAGLSQQARAASLSYPADFTLAGNASNPSTGVIQLTPNSGGQKGAVFSKSRLSVNSAFTITADIYLGNSDAGADGVAFVLQPNSTTTLSSGGGLGYDGVTNAFAVEFDTYNNGGQEGAADHAGLMKSNATNHSEWTSSSSVYNFGVNVEDNKWRAFEIIWTPAASATATCGASSGKGTIKVLFDINSDGSKDTLYNNVCIDLQTYFKSYGYSAYFGFTAATGGATNVQSVRNMTSDVSVRVNQAPTISPISNVTYLKNAGAKTLAVTLSDDGTTSAQWGATVTSSNTSVVTVSSAGSYPTVSGGSTGTFNLNLTPSSVNTGTSTITLTVTDADGATATRTFTVTVRANDISPFTRIVAGDVSTALSIAAYTATGFTTSPTYSISPALPTGLTLNTSTGAITGTAASTLATTNYTITASNASSQSASATLTLTIAAAARSLSPSSQTIVVAKDVSMTSTSTLTPANFETTPTYSVSPALPNGLSLNTSTGVVSGTPIATQSATNYTITAANANGETAQATISLAVGYQVTFDSQGGSAVANRYFLSGGSLTLPSAPTYANYSFNGWYSAATGGVLRTSPFTPGVNNNITLYAQWTYIPPFKVVYYANNATSGTVPVDSRDYLVSDSATVLTNSGNLVRTGYTFGGWALNSGGTGTIYTNGMRYQLSVNPTNFYAKWNPLTYTVTYNTNGATGSAQRSAAVVNSDTFTVGVTTNVSLPLVGSMSKAGHTFDGWSTTANGSAVNSPYVPTSSVTLYARWLIKTVNVEYDKGIASAATFVSFPGSSSGNFNSVVALPTPNPTALTIGSDNYLFGGWNDGSKEYAAGHSLRLPDTSTVNLVAQWIPLLNVRYFLNGGSVGGSSASRTDSECISGTNQCTEGQPITTDPAPSRSGYTFAGWKLGSTTLDAGVTANVTSSDFIFTAQWSPNTYPVTYAASGGSSTPSQPSLSIYETFTVATAISRPGYSFTGWYETATALSFAPGSIFIVEDRDVEFSAQWSAETYVISYDWNGGVGSGTPDVTYTSGTGPFTLPPVGDHVKDGATFARWSTDPSGSVVLPLDFVPTSSVTLYAIWGVGNYTITFNDNYTSGTTTTDSVVSGGSKLLPNRSRTNFTFNGWFDATTGGSLIGLAGAQYTPTGSSTIYARWTQNSLSGVAESALFQIGTITASGSSDVTITSSGLDTTIAITVQQGSLPDGTVIKLYVLSSYERARATIGNDKSPVTSVLVAWLATDDTVPDTDPNKPISVTISNANIKRGMSYYRIVNGVSTLLGTATVDGSVTALLTADPEVVVVATRPTPPLNPVATNGENGKSTVSWQSPQSDGGSSITGYTVSAVGAPSLSCSTTGALSCEVTGLTNGSAYTFRVTATNAIGTSDTSAATSSITPVAPASGGSSGGGGGSSGGGSTGPRVTAVYFRVMDPVNTSSVYAKTACISVYSRDLNPRFLASGCSDSAGNINLLIEDSKITVKVYQQGYGDQTRDYVGVIESDVVSITDSKYFAGTTRWVVSVPSPKNEVVTPTPTPTPPPTPTPTPVPTLDLGAVTSQSAQKLGSVTSLLSGKGEDVTILPNKTSDGVVISGDKWSLEIIALDSDGKARKLNTDGSLNAVIEGKIKVIGNGYLGASDYRIFLFANLVLAENSRTNEAGGFTWSFVLPAAITSGKHTIQVNGVSTARQVRSTSVGITVSAKPVPVTPTKPTVKPTPKPKSTVGVIPFNFGKYLVGSKQLSVVKKLNLSGSKLQISLTGYAQRNGTRDDLRISLDRALEVKKTILKIAPKAVITVYGGGTKPVAQCKSFSNRCVIATISSR